MDAKIKNSKRGSKKKELLIKPKKSTKKKTKRKTKKDKGVSTSLDHFFSQFRKLSKLRGKGHQRVEGMFFNGLRSEYISRKSLNEANEARKNEDINKIIDIGRIFLKKGQVKEDKEEEKIKKSPVLYKKTSIKKIGKTEESSSISYTNSFSYEEKNPKKKKKLNLEKEFLNFAYKYEQTVGAEIFLKLPENGILEESLQALAKLQDKKKENEIFSEANDFFHNIQDFKFLNENKDDDFIENLFHPQEEKTFRENFSGEEDVLITTDFQSQNYSHLSFFYNDVIDHQQDQIEEKYDKDLVIATPSVQFYRRNMF